MKRETGHVDAGSRRRVRTDAARRSKRRKLLFVLGASALTAPLAPFAQQPPTKIPRIGVRSSNDFAKAFEDATRARAGALAIMPNALFAGNLKRIVDLATKSRLPSIFHLSEFADSGGLVAYGPDRSDQFRRAAAYVDKILKGAKPGDLPIEQPSKFELVINLKTAKALGIKIPNSILLRADRVIE